MARHSLDVMEVVVGLHIARSAVARMDGMLGSPPRQIISFLFPMLKAGD